VGFEYGLLVVRLGLGLAIAAHGAQKLFGWFGGHGLAGTGGFFEAIGFRPGKPFAAIAGFGEGAGGLLIALGLFGPVGPALVLATMIVAAVAVHLKNGFWAANNGVELAYVYAFGALAIAFAGFGSLSLDTLLRITPTSPSAVYGVLAVGAIAGLLTLPLRRPAPQPAPVTSA
jgi:putative oxidoreductase